MNQAKEKTAELEKLYASYAAAVRAALDGLVAHGEDSPVFRQADADADKIWVEIRPFLIVKGKSS